MTNNLNCKQTIQNPSDAFRNKHSRPFCGRLSSFLEHGFHYFGQILVRHGCVVRFVLHHNFLGDHISWTCLLRPEQCIQRSTSKYYLQSQVAQSSLTFFVTRFNKSASVKFSPVSPSSTSLTSRRGLKQSPKFRGRTSCASVSQSENDDSTNFKN